MGNNQSKSVHETACMESHAGNVILHLSDLHFLENSTPKRTGIGKELIDIFANIEPEWKPNIVCITGDISDKNNSEGYVKAEEWIKKLLLKLEIPPDNLIMCPGNHDVDTQKAKAIACPKSPQEIEEQLKIPISPEYKDLFSSFTTLSRNLGIKPLDYNKASSYLFGAKEINGIYFIACNSCWFYKYDEKDENNKGIISIGLPLLEHLENKYDFRRKKQKDLTKTVALMHHPEKGLSWMDTVRYCNRPTLAVLTEMANLVLTGHLHGLPVGKTEYNSTPFLNCGTALQDSVENTFALIRIEDGRFVYQFYRTDHTRCKNRWIKDNDPENILCNQPLTIVNEFLDSYGTVSLLGDRLLVDSPKVKKRKSESFDSTIPIESMPVGTTSIKLDIDDIFDEIERSLEKADQHIKRLEYTKAFSIVDDIKKDIKPLESSSQNEMLSEIYMRISLIECTRANCLHIKKDVPVDYSCATKYFKKAQKAHGK